MAPDWIPDDDDAFDAFANQLVPPIVANPADFGLTAAQATVLGTALHVWTTKRAEQTARLNAAKDGAKEALTVLMRTIPKLL